MTDDELKQLVASLAIKSDKLDKQLSELAASQIEVSEKFKQIKKDTADEMKKIKQETSDELKKASKLLGVFGRNLGEITEEFFYNSLAEDAHLGEIRFDDISKNEQKRRGKTEEEYDIVMTNGNAIGIVEVKYKAHQNDLQKLERKMRNFKLLFPWFKDYKLYGAIASFHINDDAKNEALQRGFFVLQRAGKVIHTECAENVLVM